MFKCFLLFCFNNSFASRTCLLLILLQILLYTSIPAQSKHQIDSIRTLLESDIEDTRKVEHLCMLAQLLGVNNPDSAIVLGHAALRLSERLKWPMGIYQSYYQIGTAMFRNHDDKEAIAFFKKALSGYDELEKNATGAVLNIIKEKKAKILGNIGSAYQDLGDFPTALEYQNKALEKFKQNKDSNFIAGTNGNIGLIYREQGNYPLAFEYYFMALRIKERMGEKKGMARQLGNIGNAYVEVKEYAKAIESFQTAYNLSMETQNENFAASMLTQIGIVYETQNRLSQSLDFYTKALNQYSQLKDVINIAEANCNIGTILLLQHDTVNAVEQFRKGLQIDEEIDNSDGMARDMAKLRDVCSGQGNYSKAIDFGLRVVELVQEAGDKMNVAIAINDLGLLLLKNKKYTDAEKQFQGALAIATEIGSLEDMRNAYENLSNCYQQLGKPDMAFRYYKRSVAIKDSLLNEDKNKEITRTVLSYEYEVKQARLKAEKDMEIEKQKNLRNNFAVTGGVILLTAIVSLIFYKRKRDAEQKQKEIAATLRITETELKALRLQINPHFIYNAMQSIQDFFSNHNASEADKYIVMFSDLMATVLENSERSEIPLSMELKTLEWYIQLQNLRVPFEYQFHIENDVDSDNIPVPPNILQPFIENSIKHGLLPKQSPGRIDIYISKKENDLHIIIEDDGIGRSASQSSQQSSLLKRQSFGIKITQERLNNINLQHNQKAYFKIVDLLTGDKASGTRIELNLPF